MPKEKPSVKIRIIRKRSAGKKTKSPVVITKPKRIKKQDA